MTDKHFNLRVGDEVLLRDRRELTVTRKVHRSDCNTLTARQCENGVQVSTGGYYWATSGHGLFADEWDKGYNGGCDVVEVLSSSNTWVDVFGVRHDK